MYLLLLQVNRKLGIVIAHEKALLLLTDGLGYIESRYIK